MATYKITGIYDNKAGITASIEEDGGGEEITLILKPSMWKDTGLKKDDFIDGEQLSLLREAAEVCRAIARSENMLASSDYSRGRLISRLLHYGFERPTAEAAADYMADCGYIKEKEQTERITRAYCKSKHYGKKRIAAELMGRGYDRRVIMEALASVSEEEYYASLLALVHEKYPEPAADRAEKEKRIAALGRMGHGTAEILRALKEAEEDFE